MNPSTSNRSRGSVASRLVVVGALAVALLATMVLPAHAQTLEGTVEREVFVGDNVAPLAPVRGGGAMTSELVDGDLPAGISLQSNGSFTGAVTAAGQSVALIELADIESGAEEVRTVIFTAVPKPTEQVGIELDAEVGVDLFALIVNAEESQAELVAGELPPGISLVGGQFVQGVPTRGGVFISRLAATNDLFGNSEDISLTITVGDTAVREELTAVRAELLAAKSELTELRTKRAELNAAIKQMNAELSDLRAKRAEATTRAERLEIRAAIAEVKAERAVVIADRNGARALIADGRSGVTELRSRIAELKELLA